MALSNYQELKAAISGVDSFSHRDDIGGLVDEFITIAETEMFNGSQGRLRVREMLVTESSATSAIVRTQALPTGYLEIRSFFMNIGTFNRAIDYLTPQQLYVRDGTGTPCAYTITSQIEYDIIPDDTYATSIIYYATPTGISASNTTNAVLTAYPTIYLYGCLWAIAQWSKNDEDEIKYYQKFIAAITGANQSDFQGKVGTGAQKRRRGRSP